MSKTAAEIHQTIRQTKFICTACGSARDCDCAAPAMERLAAQKEATRQRVKAHRARKAEEKQSARNVTHDPVAEAEVRKRENAAKFDDGGRLRHEPAEREPEYYDPVAADEALKALKAATEPLADMVGKLKVKERKHLLMHLADRYGWELSSPVREGEYAALAIIEKMNERQRDEFFAALAEKYPAAKFDPNDPAAEPRSGADICRDINGATVAIRHSAAEYVRYVGAMSSTFTEQFFDDADYVVRREVRWTADQWTKLADELDARAKKKEAAIHS